MRVRDERDTRLKILRRRATPRYSTRMTSHEYRFGDYRLAPAARELWYREQLVALPPKSLDCLIWLVEHRERAVGRD